MSDDYEACAWCDQLARVGHKYEGEHVCEKCIREDMTGQDYDVGENDE